MSKERTPSVPAGETPATASSTTSNAAPAQGLPDITIPAINTGAPVELDSTPVSPVKRKESWKAKPSALGLSEEDEAEEEDMDPEKRKAMLASRAKDPGVLVDIPNTPGAEEYEIAQDALGQGVARRSSVVAVTPNDVAAIATAAEPKTAAV